MSKIDYTINFRQDYKASILDYFKEEGIEISHINSEDIFKLSLEFHAYQKSLMQQQNISEETSMDPKYSSDMMFKWLNHLEDQIEESIEHIVELAREHNITVSKFPLHIQLQLDIKTRSFEIYETQNQFNINLEL